MRGRDWSWGEREGLELGREGGIGVGVRGRDWSWGEREGLELG